MDAYVGYLILLGLIAGYIGAVVFLWRSGRLGPEKPLALFYGAIMIKTRKGRGALDRIGRFARFWSLMGDLAVALAAISMVIIVGLLAFEAVLVTSIPASEAPSPQTALGLPGINPIIPIGYGLVALILGVAIHELFHGIMARSQKIGVKSMGVLWFVIPVGAFVEQEEADMTSAPRRKRLRVVGAGVLANFGIAILCFSLCSLAVHTAVTPNATGVGVAGVLPGYPAANASMGAGDIITSVNGSATPNDVVLSNVLAVTHPGESVAISYTEPGGTSRQIDVVLASYEEYSHLSTDASRGFLGVSITPLTPAQLSGVLSAPWSAPGGPLAGVALWTILPLWTLQPVQGTTVTYFHVTGPLAGLGSGTIWVGINLLYWLSWMNLLLGLSNCLPIYLLDGGLLFRDLAGGTLARLRRGWDAARNDRAAGQAATVASLVLVFLLLWLFVGPRL